jgi:hypothetical protein
MLWPRQVCPFGLADETVADAAEGTHDVVLAAIGRVLRITAADITDIPLPKELVRLLDQMQPRRSHRRERSARAIPSMAKRHHQAEPPVLPLMPKAISGAEVLAAASSAMDLALPR